MTYFIKEFMSICQMVNQEGCTFQMLLIGFGGVVVLMIALFKRLKNDKEPL
jgi:hypothetical protein